MHAGFGGETVASAAALGLWELHLIPESPNRAKAETLQKASKQTPFKIQEQKENNKNRQRHFLFCLALPQFWV